MADDADPLVARGRAALLACDWDAAEKAFRASLADAATPEALDGLGQARYWQHDYAAALPLREQAFGRYRERGDRRAAAHVAVQLAQLHGLIHGNGVAVSGWLGHAKRLLDECDDCVEHGWLELFRGCISTDPREREDRTRRAMEVGRRFGSSALEFDALGYLAKARVEQGYVAEGLALLDEATAAAASGLVQDPWAAGEIYCTLFHTCEMTGDLRRAQAWLATVGRYVARTGELPIAAICRMHYGGLLTFAGRWHDAERELTDALAVYADTYVGTRTEPLVRMADLRVRQGRLEEADRLLEGLEDHPAAALAVARLLHARGEHRRAARTLRRLVPEPPCPVPAAPALALRVEVSLTLGDAAIATADVDELARLAGHSGLAALRGLAARARAHLAATTGGDVAAHLEDAIEAFAAGGLTHDGATTRLELAALLAPDAPDVARADARAALRELRRLGATRHADAAAALLRELGEPARATREQGTVLTTRQAEVLALVAEGLSNAAIAERLYISPRTAEHHVANILATLGLRSRAEAAAWAVRHGPA